MPQAEYVSLPAGPRFWWVNQGPTLVQGYSLDILWASLADLNGHRVSHWESVSEIREGDFTLHYANGYLRGVGLVLGPSREMVRPPAWTSEGRADDVGRQVTVKYQALEQPLPLDSIPLESRTRPQFGGPFAYDGKVKRGYVFALNTDLALGVLDLAGLVASDDELGELYDPTDEEAREFVFLGVTDKAVKVMARGERGALRHFVFGNRTYANCGLCGDEFPVQLLHTAHIKKRSKCSDRERRDGNVVMPACLLGCDALFEHGYITVEADGRIVRAAGAPEPASGRLVGVVALAHKAETEPYFAWHRANSFRKGVK